MWEWRRIEILHHFRQLFLDLLFVIGALLVAASIYRLVDLIVDIGEAFEIRDVEHARKAVRAHLRGIAMDFWDLFAFFWVWETYRFILAISVWGTFLCAVTLH